MNSNKYININETPVRTKSWVGVNDISLKDYKGLEIKEFTNSNLYFGEGATVKKLELCKHEKLSNNLIYGVGRELTKEADNLYNKGYIVKIDKDIELEEPIVIKFDMDGYNNSLVDNLNIIAEEGSKATIVINYKSWDDKEGYHNGVCRVVAKKGSDLKIIKVNLLNNNTGNFDSIEGTVEEGANIDYVAIDFGGKYSVTNYHGDLVGNKGSSTINSIYLGDDKKTIDINYIMTHKGKGTKSKIVTNGALKDESKKTFKGTIDFKRGASKSEGAESEYCMLLSEKARSKAMPLLLCEEDDVSGEHAASSGNIDENKLFYLMSRGLSYKEARKVIVQGAFNPIIDMIPVDDIREEVLAELDRRLVNG
ncbi:Fe-S cluster assembly protein SufD [Clostridium sp. LP20]|uniref:Fe-S cluster assembly protein SufD n=1 Tax=Clostridium sp. LP20 TaxID=3418665 RepID=UPI003EE6BB00